MEEERENFILKEVSKEIINGIEMNDLRAIMKERGISFIDSQNERTLRRKILSWKILINDFFDKYPKKAEKTWELWKQCEIPLNEYFLIVKSSSFDINQNSDQEFTLDHIIELRMISDFKNNFPQSKITSKFILSLNSELNLHFVMKSYSKLKTALMTSLLKAFNQKNIVVLSEDEIGLVDYVYSIVLDIIPELEDLPDEFPNFIEKLFSSKRGFDDDL